MIRYFTIPSADMAQANQWVVDNVDPNGGNTWVVNMEDGSGNQYCLISLPDNGSDYNNAMDAQFGSTTDDPRLTAITPPESSFGNTITNFVKTAKITLGISPVQITLSYIDNGE